MAELIECPNCYEHRRGRYCGSCGQNDRDYRRSLPPMVGALLKIGPGLFTGYYYFFALRRYYGQARLVTCFKFWLLLLAYSFLLGPSMLAVAVVTLTML